MQNIIISASDTWGYFQKHKKELKTTEHIIAENEEYGVVITITEEKGIPCFIVTSDDYQYADEVAISESDCTKTVEELYDEYLTGRFIMSEDSAFDIEDAISEREAELDDAIINLIDVAMELESTEYLGLECDEICADVKDHILEYLYRKHGISTRRPMMLEDEDDKEEFYAEYPYECMVFDDEDNPLYKDTNAL